MERVKQRDKIKNAILLERVGEGTIMLELIKKRESNWLGSAHSPNFPSLHLRHSSFSNPSVALPTSQYILQPYRCFTYFTSSSLNSPGEPPMVGFVVDESKSWQVFLRDSPVFPYHRLHSTLTSCSFHSFSLISFHPPLLWCGGLVGILAIHRPIGPIRASSRIIPRPGPALSRTRIEEIFQVRA